MRLFSGTTFICRLATATRFFNTLLYKKLKNWPLRTKQIHHQRSYNLKIPTTAFVAIQVWSMDAMKMPLFRQQPPASAKRKMNVFIINACIHCRTIRCCNDFSFLKANSYHHWGLTFFFCHLKRSASGLRCHFLL